MDRRTKRQKLQDMAKQTVSPNEAEIARQKLESLSEDEPSSVGRGEGKISIGGIEFTFEGNIHMNTDFEVGTYDFQKDEWTWFKPSG